MDFKELLIQEKKSLSERIDAINIALRAYGIDGDAVDSAGNSPLIFPPKATREKKLFWILENHFKRGARLPDIQAIFSEFTGTDATVDNVCRNLKSEGKLVLVKYNGRNKLCYWGLPTWIQGNDYADQFKPELDIEVESSEVIG